MKLVIDNQTYYVQFYHFASGENYGAVTFNKGRGTAAILHKELGDSQQEICSECSFCNPVDNFVKSTGRKMSFTRLLNSMQKLGIISTREHRTIAWKTYFENFRKEK